MTTTGSWPAPAARADEANHGALRPAAGLPEVTELAHRIAANVQHVLVGKPDVVRIALVTLLAEGHLLVEDVPGVGKTSLAKALALSIDCSVSRVQFTPDLLPGDITGMSIYNRRTEEFEFYLSDLNARALVIQRGMDSPARAVRSPAPIRRSTCTHCDKGPVMLRENNTAIAAPITSIPTMADNTIARPLL